MLSVILGSVAWLASPCRADTGVHPGNDREVACLARNVYYEARGETVDGMLAVASVVMNRSERTGMTPCSVVGEHVNGRCQFSWACASHPPPSGEDWNRAMAVASGIMDGGLPDISGGATFFSRCGHPPTGGTRLSTRIGPHCFYATTDVPVQKAGYLHHVLEADPMQWNGWVVLLDEEPPGTGSPLEVVRPAVQSVLHREGRDRQGAGLHWGGQMRLVGHRNHRA